MKLKARELIKVLLSQECVKQKEIVEELNKISSEKYTPSGLSHKIGRGTITYDEVVLIADILGYDVKVIKREA